MKIVFLMVIFLILAAVMYFTSVPSSNKKEVILGNKLKNNEIELIPDDQLESKIMKWLFDQVDEKGTTEISIIRAMPEPCRYVYAVYVITGEVCSRGFGKSFGEINSYFFSMAISGFLAMGTETLAEIVENACGVTGKFIAENGRKNISELENNEELLALDNQFSTCEDMMNLSEKLVNYVKENSDCFGDE